MTEHLQLLNLGGWYTDVHCFVILTLLMFKNFIMKSWGIKINE